MSESTYTMVVWPDADMPQGHDFLMIEKCDGAIICVFAKSKAADAKTLADAWAAYRMLGTPRPRDWWRRIA